jgi:hypothetical protein
MRILTAVVVGLFGFVVLFFLTALLVPNPFFDFMVALFGGGTLAAFVLMARHMETSA